MLIYLACEKVSKQEKSEKSTASTSASQKSVDLNQPDFQKRHLNQKVCSENYLKDHEHHLEGQE